MPKPETTIKQRRLSTCTKILQNGSIIVQTHSIIGKTLKSSKWDILWDVSKKFKRMRSWIVTYSVSYTASQHLPTLLLNKSPLINRIRHPMHHLVSSDRKFLNGATNKNKRSLFNTKNSSIGCWQKDRCSFWKSLLSAHDGSSAIQATKQTPSERTKTI